MRRRINLSLLWLTVAAAIIVRPTVSTVVAGALVVAIGAGRSIRRWDHWTLADHVTTFRLGLIVVFCALAWDGPGFPWPAVALGAVALALDAMDGMVARRYGSTAAGAAYDEAVDALFILVLGLGLVPVWGFWTVLPGALYYLYHAVAIFRSAWQRPLPSSNLRKGIAAAQGVLLLFAGTPLAQEYSWLGLSSLGIAIATLGFSFGKDVRWLELQAHRPSGSSG